MIGGRAGGAVEAVDDGSTGILVDGNRPEDILRAVSLLLADPEMARRIGEARPPEGQRERLAQQVAGVPADDQGIGGKCAGQGRQPVANEQDSSQRSPHCCRSGA